MQNNGLEKSEDFYPQRNDTDSRPLRNAIDYWHKSILFVYFVLMNVLILLRGLPGAGKSTLAGILSENRYPVYSVDDYFTDPQTGRYTFRHTENHLAYQQCETNTRIAMEAGHPKIFVHNTFTLQWEMEPYFKLAATHHYAIHVVTVENYHGNENVHGIPREQLEKMAAKYPLRLL